jgi:hypothetical protein
MMNPSNGQTYANTGSWTYNALGSIYCFEKLTQFLT